MPERAHDASVAPRTRSFLNSLAGRRPLPSETDYGSMAPTHGGGGGGCDVTWRGCYPECPECIGDSTERVTQAVRHRTVWDGGLGCGGGRGSGGRRRDALGRRVNAPLPLRAHTTHRRLLESERRHHACPIRYSVGCQAAIRTGSGVVCWGAHGRDPRVSGVSACRVATLRATSQSVPRDARAARVVCLCVVLQREHGVRRGGRVMSYTRACYPAVRIFVTARCASRSVKRHWRVALAGVGGGVARGRVKPYGFKVQINTPYSFTFHDLKPRLTH